MPTNATQGPHFVSVSFILQRTQDSMQQHHNYRIRDPEFLHFFPLLYSHQSLRTNPEHVSPQARQIKSVGETGQVEVHLLKREKMCTRTHTHACAHTQSKTHRVTPHTQSNTDPETHTHTQMQCHQKTRLIQLTPVLFKMAGIYITAQESPLYILHTLPHTIPFSQKFPQGCLWNS